MNRECRASRPAIRSRPASATPREGILKTALDHSTSAIAVADRRGTILYVNEAFVRLTGHSASELIGQNPRVLRSGAHQREFYQQLWDTILGGDTWRGVVINRRKNGQLFESELSIVPVKDRAGKVVQFVATHREITQSRRIETELRERLRSSREVIHDLAAILSRVAEGLEQSIFALAWLRPPRRAAPSAESSHTDRVLREVREDIADLNTLARIVDGANPNEILDIQQTMVSVLRASGGPWAKKVRTFERTPPDPVRGDPHLLRELIRNVIERVLAPTGAERLKATASRPTEGRVAVRLEASGLHRAPAGSATTPATPRLEDPTRIGLEMARATISALGGELVLERQADALIVDLLLPAAIQRESAAAGSTTPAPSPTATRESPGTTGKTPVDVLLITGDAGLAETFVTTICSAGDEDWRFHPGVEAAHIVEDLRARRYQLVVMDLETCPFRPFDLVQEMSKAAPSLPIIVLSERGGERLAVELMKAGASEFLLRDERWLWTLPRVVSSALLARRTAMELDQVRTDFVGMVSHDLKNPLLAILGFANLLLENAQASTLPADMRRWIGRIRENCNFGLELIGDHLDSIRLDSRSMQLNAAVQGIDDLIAECLERNRFHASQKNIRLVARSSTRVKKVRCDRGKMLQALNNLVGNAIKFSDPGSTVELRPGAPRGWVTFTVQDHGRGIAATELSLLFKKFSRTSTRPTGGEKSTGLGLYIVSEIVKLHGGTITVVSALGQGSTFMVKLPRRDESDETRGPQPG